MILGLCGPKESGKSTLAELLAKEYQFARTAFADPIKEMLTALVIYQGGSISLARRMFWGDLKETPSEYLGGQTPRWAMQSLGTEWGRKLIHPDLWVKAWSNKVSTSLNQITVDDLRHENEAQEIRNLGGKTIKIVRSGTMSGVHSSEQEYEQINCDLTVYNDSTPQKMLDTLTDIWGEAM